MNNELWQQAKEIFDEARQLSGSDQAKFLDERCSKDPALRAEVEKLLSSYDSDFLEENALNAAEALIDPALATGQTIGRYRISGLIGSGGMGQVFLAEDTELDRPVAFKILHGGVANDEERVRRFIQEARAASALNHPNILTIHEIGSFEGSRFIVSEYVHGRTLREQMRDGVSAAESLTIACQIATALKAAHAAGIIHRDIKPENIMIRQDGLVKVLDFGLAKLTEADDRPIDQNSVAASILETSPGLVMGTVAYMSPEQARGQSVDLRTDLWSLGIVLHEMLTGDTPYKGEAVTELVAAILTSDATPIEIESIPAGMQPICRRLLAKERDSRYQSAHDLLTDLEGEKDRMKYAIDSKKYVTVSSTDERRTQIIGPRRTLSAEYVVHQVTRHKYLTLSVVFTIMFVALGLTVYRYNAATNQDSNTSSPAFLINAATTEKDLKFSKLPISGPSAEISISPDGKYVAYTDKKGINLLELATNVSILTSELPPADGEWGLTFSPDNKFIYYVYEVNADFGSDKIMRVPVHGGKPEVITGESPDSWFGLSSDGSKLVFVRQLNGGRGGEEIVLANSDGSNKRTLEKTSPGTEIPTAPIFSPDDKTVACPIAFKEANTQYFKLIGYSTGGGDSRTISDKHWREISGGVWLPNGNLVIAAADASSDSQAVSQLWNISPDGQARALTSGLVGYRGLGATRDGTILVSHQIKTDNNLWMLPNNESSKAQQVTSSGEIRGGFAYASDGRIIIGSNITGNADLWMINVDKADRKRLTNEGGVNVQPVISPDNKYIVFCSNRGDGKIRLYRMDMDGQNARRLADQAGDIIPYTSRISIDGKSVFYVEVHDGKADTIRKVPIDGGEAVTVAKPPDGWEFTTLDINRTDGRFAYGLTRKSNGPSEYKIEIASADGKKTERIIDLPPELGSRNTRWMPDGGAVAVLEKSGFGQTEVWRVPIDGKGKPSKLTDFRTPVTNNFLWTPDGKFMLASRGTRAYEAVLIRVSAN